MRRTGVGRATVPAIVLLCGDQMRRTGVGRATVPTIVTLCGDQMRRTGVGRATVPASHHTTETKPHSVKIQP